MSARFAAETGYNLINLFYNYQEYYAFLHPCEAGFKCIGPPQNIGHLRRGTSAALMEDLESSGRWVLRTSFHEEVSAGCSEDQFCPISPFQPESAPIPAQGDS